MRNSGFRRLVCGWGLFALVACLLAPATGHANAKVARQVADKTAEAMEAYDLLEYESAKKGLAGALLLAKRNGLGKDMVTARVHLYLGIVYFSGFGDEDAAQLEFTNALEIDSSLELPRAYRTKDMAAMFGELRSAFGASADPGGEELASAENCDGVEGLEHELVETAPRGADRQVEVQVGRDVEFAKVALFYRPEGVVDFEEVTMGRQGGCSYRGSIPASATGGEILHYYVAAVDKRGKALASKGSKLSPNIMEITAAVANRDGEDPFAPSDASAEKSVELAPEGGKKLFINVSAGSGAGYVTGSTEVTNVDVECCLAPALFHVSPEVGYWMTPSTSISGVFRMGFTVGANVPGHSTAAPAGFLRIRHAFGEAGTGFTLSGSIGGGIIRHTVKISNASPGEDTDTVATGPLLFGAGIGYIKSLSGPVRLVAELHSTVGVPVVDEIGCPGNGCVQPNFGSQFDANLGLQLAF